MKKIIITLSILVFALQAFAQSPYKISYQAVIRDAGNGIIANTQVGTQISILQGSSTGTAVFVETHMGTTNDNGLLSLEIGGGTVVSGSMAAIDWSAGPYFIQSETDPAGGTSYSITGVSELASVPFAFQAIDADTAKFAIKAGTAAQADSTNTAAFAYSVPSTVRSIVITPGMIPSNSFFGGTALGSIGGWAHPCIDYPDGVTSMVRISLPSPADWDGNPMSVKILYTSDGTTGDFAFNVNTRGLAIGDNINQGVGGPGPFMPSPSSVNVLAEASLPAGFGIQKTDQAVMNIWFRRLGADVGDTSPSILRVVGFVVSYNTK